eukprot:9763371-Heterocapsa_arctica.AAC.1
MPEQVFDGEGEEQEVTRVLYSNSTKWGNQPNHYDLLVPHVEAERPHIRMHDGKYGRNKMKNTGRQMTEEQRLDNNVVIPSTKKSVRMVPGPIPSMSLDRSLTLNMFWT